MEAVLSTAKVYPRSGFYVTAPAHSLHAGGNIVEKGCFFGGTLPCFINNKLDF